MNRQIIFISFLLPLSLAFLLVFSTTPLGADPGKQFKNEDTIEHELDNFKKNTWGIKNRQWGAQNIPSYSRPFTIRYFDDWEIECLDDHGCLAAHKVYLDSGRQLMLLSVKISDNGEPPLITLVLPLGFYLPDQVRMYMGANSVYHKFTVQHCIDKVCVALADNPSRLIHVLTQKEDEKAAVVLQKLNRNKLFVINFSRRGFTESYAYLKAGEDKRWHD
ncbi:MAG: invasion associated locus B family protein [Magnetococcales bacterium]|nr:invasion associated locus B family protein [Magnetococcales bacterium]